MKGYDVVVFPREGEPTLIVPRAVSRRRRRARPGRATCASSQATTATTRGRRPRARSSSPSRSAARDLRPHRPRALARHAGGRPHGRRADDLHRRPGSTPSRAPTTRRRCSPRRARSRPSRRSSGCGSRTSSRPSAMEHVTERLRPGMARGEAARSGRATSTATGTGYAGKVELALGFSLVWSGPGIRTFTATGYGPVQENEPTLFEIWVCADGYWCDHTKNVCPGEPRPALRRAARDRCSASTTPRVASLPPGAEPRRARPADPRRHRRGRLSRPALPPGLPRRRRPCARAAVRAPGRGGHDRGGHGARDRAGDLLARRRRPATRGQLPGHPRTAREALPLPGRLP